MEEIYSSIRTDLALEARELRRVGRENASEIPGVEAHRHVCDGYPITTVRVLNETGEKELCKPIGNYVTMELDALARREQDAFPRAVRALSAQIAGLLALSGEESLLVVGLGNPAITPDAIGPQTLDYVLVTRHLRQHAPESFRNFRAVSALKAGVLGTTGVESAEMVRALVQMLRPDRVIAVDALASCRLARLCRTVQLTDTGIVPGSGVGNHRSALTKDSLGVPVLAIGVPTVVDAATLASDLAESAGAPAPDRERFGDVGKMVVTPRDIDRSVHDAARLVGYAIDLAVHRGLSVEDVDLFL